jgi:hypothetical protein
LTQLRTAKDWGLSPEQFRKCGKRAQAEMIATTEIINVIDAYYSEWIAENTKPKLDNQPTRGKRR